MSLAAMSSIASIASSGAQIFGSLFGGGGNSGPHIISDYDHQRQLDRAEQAFPGELSRQQRFLSGMAPAEADAYNLFRDRTYGGDSGAMKKRMDTLYPGTTPWERLGAPKPDAITAPQHTGKGQSNQLFSAIANAGAQTTAAKESAKATKTAAALGALGNVAGSLAGADATKTAARTGLAGVLDRNEIERVKTGLQKEQIDNQMNRWSHMTNNERSGVLNQTFKIMFDALPREKFTAGVYEITGINPGTMKKLTSRLQAGQAFNFDEDTIPTINDKSFGDTFMQNLQGSGNSLVGFLQSFIQNQK